MKNYLILPGERSLRFRLPNFFFKSILRRPGGRYIRGRIAPRVYKPLNLYLRDNGCKEFLTMRELILVYKYEPDLIDFGNLKAMIAKFWSNNLCAKHGFCDAFADLRSKLRFFEVIFDEEDPWFTDVRGSGITHFDDDKKELMDMLYLFWHKATMFDSPGICVEFWKMQRVLHIYLLADNWTHNPHILNLFLRDTDLDKFQVLKDELTLFSRGNPSVVLKKRFNRLTLYSKGEKFAHYIITIRIKRYFSTLGSKSENLVNFVMLWSFKILSFNLTSKLMAAYIKYWVTFTELRCIRVTLMNSLRAAGKAAVPFRPKVEAIQQVYNTLIYILVSMHMVSNQTIYIKDYIIFAELRNVRVTHMNSHSLWAAGKAAVPFRPKVEAIQQVYNTLIYILVSMHMVSNQTIYIKDYIIFAELRNVRVTHMNSHSLWAAGKAAVPFRPKVAEIQQTPKTAIDAFRNNRSSFVQSSNIYQINGRGKNSNGILQLSLGLFSKMARVHFSSKNEEEKKEKVVRRDVRKNPTPKNYNYFIKKKKGKRSRRKKHPKYYPIVFMPKAKNRSYTTDLKKKQVQRKKHEKGRKKHVNYDTLLHASKTFAKTNEGKAGHKKYVRDKKRKKREKPQTEVPQPDLSFRWQPYIGLIKRIPQPPYFKKPIQGRKGGQRVLYFDVDKFVSHKFFPDTLNLFYELFSNIFMAFVIIIFYCLYRGYRSRYHFQKSLFRLEVEQVSLQPVHSQLLFFLLNGAEITVLGFYRFLYLALWLYFKLILFLCNFISKPKVSLFIKFVSVEFHERLITKISIKRCVLNEKENLYLQKMRESVLDRGETTNFETQDRKLSKKNFHFIMSKYIALPKSLFKAFLKKFPEVSTIKTHREYWEWAVENAVISFKNWTNRDYRDWFSWTSFIKGLFIRLLSLFILLYLLKNYTRFKSIELGQHFLNLKSIGYDIGPFVFNSISSKVNWLVSNLSERGIDRDSPLYVPEIKALGDHLDSFVFFILCFLSSSAILLIIVWLLQYNWSRISRWRIFNLIYYKYTKETLEVAVYRAFICFLKILELTFLTIIFPSGFALWLLITCVEELYLIYIADTRWFSLLLNQNRFIQKILNHDRIMKSDREIYIKALVLRIGFYFLIFYTTDFYLDSLFSFYDSIKVYFVDVSNFLYSIRPRIIWRAIFDLCVPQNTQHFFKFLISIRQAKITKHKRKTRPVPVKKSHKIKEEVSEKIHNKVGQGRANIFARYRRERKPLKDMQAMESILNEIEVASNEDMSERLRQLEQERSRLRQEFDARETILKADLMKKEALETASKQSPQEVPEPKPRSREQFRKHVGQELSKKMKAARDLVDSGGQVPVTKAPDALTPVIAKPEPVKEIPERKPRSQEQFRKHVGQEFAKQMAATAKAVHERELKIAALRARGEAPGQVVSIEEIPDAPNVPTSAQSEAAFRKAETEFDEIMDRFEKEEAAREMAELQKKAAQDYRKVRRSQIKLEKELKKDK